MIKKKEVTTIKVSRANITRINDLLHPVKGESWDSLIGKILDRAEVGGKN